MAMRDSNANTVQFFLSLWILIKLHIRSYFPSTDKTLEEKQKEKITFADLVLYCMRKVEHPFKAKTVSAVCCPVM